MLMTSLARYFFMQLAAAGRLGAKKYIFTIFLMDNLIVH